MEHWQTFLIVWAIAAFADRTVEIWSSFFRSHLSWYERPFAAFVYWVMGLAWPWQRIALPLLNWWRRRTWQRQRSLQS